MKSSVALVATASRCRLSLIAMAMSVVAAGAPSARAQFSATSGFDPADASNWAIVVTTGTSSIIGVNGNPGGFAQLSPQLQATLPVGNPVSATAGFFRGGVYPASTLAPGITHFVLRADVRVLGAAPDLTAELIPILSQGNFIYAPVPGYFFTSTSWLSGTQNAWALSDFISSQGTFNPASSFRIGFGVRLRGLGITTTRTGTYGVDNVTIQLVPAPGAAGVMGLALIATARRRRR